jgi:hypothetical protein
MTDRSNEPESPRGRRVRPGSRIGTALVILRTAGKLPVSSTVFVMLVTGGFLAGLGLLPFVLRELREERERRVRMQG